MKRTESADFTDDLISELQMSQALGGHAVKKYKLAVCIGVASVNIPADAEAASSCSVATHQHPPSNVKDSSSTYLRNPMATPFQFPNHNGMVCSGLMRHGAPASKLQESKIIYGFYCV